MNTKTVKGNSIEEQPTNYPISIWICLANIGSFYAMCESPTLHDYWKEFFVKDYSSSFEFYFNLASSISMISLIFFSFFIGLLCDLYSNSIVLIGQTIFVVLGQFLMYASFYWNFFWFFFVGRILIYLAVQTISTSTKTYLNQHVAEKEKAFMFGINSSSILISKCVVLIAQPAIVQKYGLESALLLTFGLACTSLVISFILYFLEEKMNNQSLEQIPLEKFSTQEYYSKSLQVQSQESQQSQWDQVKSFSINYWLFGFIIASSLLVTNVIDNLLPAYISSYWKIDTIDATRIASLCTFYGFFNWLMGMGYDWLQKGHEWLLFSSFASLIGQLILTQYDPVIGTAIVGLGYNMRVVAMLPLLGKFVKKESTGKAFGLIRSFKDLQSTITFLIIGIVVNETHTYQTSFQGVFIFITVYTIINLILYSNIKFQNK
ncbi:hypothetical protein ABPG72_017229 [Tetrahymena utriculariae]